MIIRGIDTSTPIVIIIETDAIVSMSMSQPITSMASSTYSDDDYIDDALMANP
jgi:hypothetical protein